MTERARIVPGNDLYYLEVRASDHWLLMNCAEKPQMLENKLAFLNEAFRQAVAEERERILKLCEKHLLYGDEERARMVPGNDLYYAVRRALEEAIRRVEDESQRDASKRLKKWQAKRRLTLDEWLHVIGNAGET